MKITGVTVHTLTGEGAQGAYGAPFAALICVATDDGIVGWGETDNHPDMVRAVIEAPCHNAMMSGLAAAVTGCNPLDTEDVWARMLHAVTNVGRDGLTLACMAGIDLALWDIRARHAGKPLCELLGGARRTEMKYYATYPLGGTLEETATLAAAAREQGVPAAKFGWTPFGEQHPEDDAGMVAALRANLGDGRTLLIDGGLAFDVERAVACSHMLADYGVHWFEEPLRPYDIKGYRALRRRSAVPVAAGELAMSRAELERLIEAECVDVLQIDLTRVGITEGLKVADAAARRGVRCVNHTYTQDISLAASLHFFAAQELIDLIEVQCTPNEIRDVLVPERPEIRGGHVLLPAGTGHGAVPDPAMLARFSDHQSLAKGH